LLSATLFCFILIINLILQRTLKTRPMKKLLLFICVSVFSFAIFAQERVSVSASLKNHSERASLSIVQGEFLFPDNPFFSDFVSLKSFSEEILGTTEYDLQSNGSVDHRIRLYADGTIGATWTIGTGTFTDRGTAYNYFDGTSWGTPPAIRIETQRTGWPSYAPLNAGEVIVSHNYPNYLVLLTRTTKGTGTWTEAQIPSPLGSAPTWPRMVTVGDTIHVIVNSYNEYAGMKQALIYMRSVDGGTTWTDVIPDGITSAEYKSINGDNYAWADPKNGILAFVVGDKWHDLFLMKSTDGGTTWTKTIIYQHPNPHPMWQVPPVYADTVYACDGAPVVELDNAGNAHVVFGIQRVLYDPLEDPTNEGAYSYFPFTDGIAYWKEGDPAFTDLNPDAVYTNGKLIAWTQDVDNSGVVLDNLTTIDEIAKYYLSLSSMPQLTIDDNDDMYLLFVSPNELLYSGTQYYNHLWARKSTDGGITWSDFSQVTGGIMHEFDECVFGAMSKTSDDYVHITFQMDDEPGLHVRGDEDPIRTNTYIYIRVLKTDIGTTSADIAQYNSINAVSVFPNPASEYVSLEVVSPVATNSTLQITTITGQLVFESDFLIEAGSTQVSIPVDTYDSGVYILTLITDKESISKKLILE
jgi:hypothetical protein